MREFETNHITNIFENQLEPFEPISDKEFKKLVYKLKNPERSQEQWLEGLDRYLEKIAEETNRELGTNLLDSDGTIRMNSFKKGEGGPYQNEGKLREDKLLVKHMEKRWSKDSGLSVEEFLEEKEKGHGDMWEKTVTVIFSKILKSDFVVARASKYDDYFHGIDTLIIDKKTGDIVCAFDEVTAREESELDKLKSKKVEEQNRKNGAKIDYGITFKDGRLIKEAIENIPVFSLRLSGGKLIDVLNKMSFNSVEGPTKTELQTFDKLLFSLEKQSEGLMNEEIPETMKTRLESFSQSLEKMKEIRNQKFD